MSLELFMVSHKTDAETVCRIIVEPGKRQCAVTITIAGRIVRMADESEPRFASLLPENWHNPPFWEMQAAKFARQYSPFWRGENLP